MKKQLFIFLAFIVLALTSNAQVTLQTFQIGQNYLQNSTTLKVPNTSVATPFKFVIITTRGISSSGGYVSGNCKISLYYTENQSADANIPDDPSSVLLKTVNITSSDYKQNQATLEDIDTSLPPNKQNGKLVVKFEFLDNQNINRVSYSSTRYGIYIVPALGNNIISLKNNGVNYETVVGTQPNGGSSSLYTYEWQIKNSSGVFVTQTYGYFMNMNNYILFAGGTIRRIIRVGTETSISNEIVFNQPLSNSFTITKTEVFDTNGVLIGNNIKINLDHPDPNVRFYTSLFGPDDPYNIPVDNNYEFFFPMYYGNDKASYYPETNAAVHLFSNIASPFAIIPTWK